MTDPTDAPSALTRRGALAGLGALSLAAVPGPARAQGGAVELPNLSYDPTRELYRKVEFGEGGLFDALAKANR